MSLEDKGGSVLVGRPHPGSERPLHGPLQAFDLAVEATRLREENERREGRRNSITLRKGGGLNVVLLAMKAGDRLEEHSAPGPIALSVREGRIRFTAEGEAALEAGPKRCSRATPGYATPWRP